MAYPEEILVEILNMGDRDHQVRLAVIEQTRQSAELDPELLQEWEEMDRCHAARIEQIILEHGWPMLSTDEPGIARAVWLLVQHADHDPKFQRRCLDQMTSAVVAGEGDRALWAMLTDRVLVKETGEQLYGTQWTRDPVSGEHVPIPMTDPARVDTRRAEVGLDSLTENRRRIQET